MSANATVTGSKDHDSSTGGAHTIFLCRGVTVKTQYICPPLPPKLGTWPTSTFPLNSGQAGQDPIPGGTLTDSRVGEMCVPCALVYMHVHLLLVTSFFFFTIHKVAE